MGNKSSKKMDTKNPSLLTSINFIATNYILTQNFKDMENLADAKYCDKLVVLTSKIIASKLSKLEITYLAQKMRGEKEINMPEKDTVILIDKTNLEDLDVGNKVKKRRMCISIAKFYVQIAHLFAAIVKTINPAYTYKVIRDGVEISETVSLRHKTDIPKGAVTSIKANNICDNRMNALLSNNTYSQLEKDDKDTVTINPKICSINNGDSLSKLPGIPELEVLYYDIYDYDKGSIEGPIKKIDPPADSINQDAVSSSSADAASAAVPSSSTDAIASDMAKDGYVDKAEKLYEQFTTDLSDKYKDIKSKYSGGGGKERRRGFAKMSDRAKEVYTQDVYEFWTTLTGKTTIPKKDGVPTIQRFSDIKSEDLEHMSDCSSTGKYKQSYTLKKSDSLFKDYANNIKTMMKNTNDTRNKLLDILSKLFSRTKNEQTDKIEVVIHPDLTENSLKALIDETRTIIVKLYITCEKDFKEGINILNAIIDKKKLEQIPSLTESIENKLDEFVSSDMFSSNDERGRGEQSQTYANEAVILAQKTIDAAKATKIADEKVLTHQQAAAPAVAVEAAPAAAQAAPTAAPAVEAVAPAVVAAAAVAPAVAPAAVAPAQAAPAQAEAAPAPAPAQVEKAPAAAPTPAQAQAAAAPAQVEKAPAAQAEAEAAAAAPAQQRPVLN